MCCDRELEDKRKLRCYKEVIKPNIEDQKYLSILNGINKTINITKLEG